MLPQLNPNRPARILPQNYGKWVSVPRGSRRSNPPGPADKKGKTRLPGLTQEVMRAQCVILPSHHARDRALNLINEASPTVDQPVVVTYPTQPIANSNTSPIAAMPTELLLYVLSYLLHSGRVYHLSRVDVWANEPKTYARSFSVHMVVPAAQADLLSTDGTGTNALASVAGVCSLWRDIACEYFYTRNVFVWELVPECRQGRLTSYVRLPQGASSYNFITPLHSDAVVLAPLTESTAAYLTDVRVMFPAHEDPDPEDLRTQLQEIFDMLATSSRLKRVELDITPAHFRNRMQLGNATKGAARYDSGNLVVTEECEGVLGVRLGGVTPVKKEAVAARERSLGEARTLVESLGWRTGVQVKVLAGDGTGHESVRLNPKTRPEHF